MTIHDLACCRVQVSAPVKVAESTGHFWFPTLHEVGGNDILCEVVVTEDKARGKWPAVLCLSRDGGASWNRLSNTCSYGPSSLPLGPRQLLLMPYELWPLSPGDRRNAKADGFVITCRDDGAVTVEPRMVRFLSFPRDLAEYHEGEVYLVTNGNVLPLRDGRLFMTVYGKFSGDKTYTNFAVTSHDAGFTWRFLSIVASGKDVPEAREGPDESATVQLADGRLMCAFRVESGKDYFKSYSADEGATWTKPECMAGVWSVEPALVRLPNGLMLLTGGRPGLFLWVCTDGQGERWERFNQAEHHNALVADPARRFSDAFCEAKERVNPAQSTSYTDMVAVGPDEALLCYDRLGNGWSGAPGLWGETDAVFCVRVKASGT